MSVRVVPGPEGAFRGRRKLFREGDVAGGGDEDFVLFVEHSYGFLEVFLAAAKTDLDLFGRRLFGERGSVG